MQLSEKEVLRYLGYRTHAADERTRQMIHEVTLAAEAEIQPKSVYMELPLRILSENEVQIGATVFKSQKLSRHLCGCERILVFAATLGAGADRLLRRFSAANSAQAAVAQAVLAAMTESYCDSVCESIAQQEEQNGWYLRPRFSPGYGDLPLTAQRDLFRLCDITKRIGIALTDSCLMLPTKSVSAFIGLTRQKDGCTAGGCALCDKTDCAYRESDGKAEENGLL